MRITKNDQNVKIGRGPKLEGCAFANFGNSSGTEGEPSQKRDPRITDKIVRFCPRSYSFGEEKRNERSLFRGALVGLKILS